MGKKLLRALSWAVLTFLLMYWSAMKMAKNKDLQINRIRQSIRSLERMLSIWENGKRLSDAECLFDKEKIAIYGNGMVGKHLTKELLNDGKKVCYILDRASFVSEFSDIPIYSTDQNVPPVDILIVTPVYEFDKIRETLSKKMGCSIIKITDLFEGL